MIFVCEPQCRGISHEKVNSGFLTLARRAFPDDVLRLYADPTHRRALEEILVRDGVTIDRVEHRAIVLDDALSVRGALAYYRLFKRMFAEAVAEGVERVLFLSSSPVLLHVLKRLRSNPAFAKIRIAFVLHADFEDIANDTFQAVAATAVHEPTILEKLRMIRIAELPGKVAGLVGRRISERYASLWQTRFREREQLEWRHDDRLAYIALAPHVRTNASKYIDVQALNVHTVEMPINFAAPRSAPRNAHLKLATFGYGDPAALRRVVDALDRLMPSKPYEIRIIGMDNRGLESHPRVVCPSPNKPLSRAEMERHAEDIDAFLILYDRNRYRLSCSGAIFEALSYVKPVLHIGNPCITPFDPPDAPIGFSTETLEELARLVAPMIDDYPAAQRAFAARRENIMRLRTRLGMDALATKLRAAFV